MDQKNGYFEYSINVCIVNMADPSWIRKDKNLQKLPFKESKKCSQNASTLGLTKQKTAIPNIQGQFSPWNLKNKNQNYF